MEGVQYSMSIPWVPSYSRVPAVKYQSAITTCIYKKIFKTNTCIAMCVSLYINAQMGINAFCHWLQLEISTIAPPWKFCIYLPETRSGLDCTVQTTNNLETKRSFLAS